MKLHTFAILAYKESDDLEECIKSVLNQTYKSNVIIVTSTPNDYIIDLASKYGLGVMINKEKSNKGRDYNFAIDSFDTKLVTVAHQDDIYDRNYTKEIVNCYKQNIDASIIFTDNYEIINDKKILKNKKLRERRRHLFLLRYRYFQNKKKIKFLALNREKYICTSSVTFVKKNIPVNLFPTNLSFDNDWLGFINLAKEDSRFVFLPLKLVGYRLHNKTNLKKLKEDKKILDLLKTTSKNGK